MSLSNQNSAEMLEIELKCICITFVIHHQNLSICKLQHSPLFDDDNLCMRTPPVENSPCSEQVITNKYITSVLILPCISHKILQ